MIEKLSRREAMKLSAAGVSMASASGWFGTLAARAAEATDGRRPKSCILLFMSGGVSQTHSVDLKDASPYRPIPTIVPGVQFSEYLPMLSRQMDKLALIRSMSTGEASHERARYLMHTGYRMGAGGVVYPSLGSIASAELGSPDSEIPNFVAIGRGTLGAGYFGPRHSPLVVTDPSRGLDNLRTSPALGQFDERAALLADFDAAAQQRYQAAPLEAHNRGYQRAVALMHSAKAHAFDIEREPAHIRAAYGDSVFGKSCLLARRLVEAGVPFVEVLRGGWDTHGQGHSKQKNGLEGIDRPYSALLQDLHQRGLLDETLVIWMGEFGRTPDDGSNHHGRAWSLMLSGAGIRMGQVIGRTDRLGTTVEDRPVGVTDFMSTICTALGIDPNKQHMGRNGRPFRIVDRGGAVVQELF